MTSATFLWILRDFVPEYHHAKFGCNWTTNKGETEGGGHNVPPQPIWLQKTPEASEASKKVIFGFLSYLVLP